MLSVLRHVGCLRSENQPSSTIVKHEIPSWNIKPGALRYRLFTHNVIVRIRSNRYKSFIRYTPTVVSFGGTATAAVLRIVVSRNIIRKKRIISKPNTYENDQRPKKHAEIRGLVKKNSSPHKRCLIFRARGRNATCACPVYPRVCRTEYYPANDKSRPRQI